MATTKLSPPVRRLIENALKSGGTIDPKEADEILNSVTEREIPALLKRLEQRGARFEPGVREQFEKLSSAAEGDRAYREMAQKLVTASKSGLTGKEIERAEAEISKKYGPQIARDVFLKAIGARVGNLTVDGVTWLQQKHGNMDGHIDRFQRVLESHLAGAKLLDANFDGKLDENDKIFTTDAAGKINVQSVGEALRDRLKIGTALVSAAEEMAGAKHDFAIVESQNFNSPLWKPMGGGTFAVAENVRPSDAVRDIFQNPHSYKFECATAIMIVHYKAMLELLGPKDFDEACKNLKIGAWEREDTLDANWEQEGGSNLVATTESKKKVHAGDYTYFKNFDVSERGEHGGWAGENVIALGANANGVQMFYAHPFGIVSGEEIVKHLNEYRKEGSQREAKQVQLRAQLGLGVLAHDKTKGE